MSSQIVIFGASGDLTRRKLVPALTSLVADGRAEHEFSVIGVARRQKTDDEFRDELRAALPDELGDSFDHLAERVFYQPGDIGDAESIRALGERLDALPGGVANGHVAAGQLGEILLGHSGA